MNIAESEQQANIIAKTSGSKEKGTKKITYSFIDTYHSLCLDKKDIISSELEACESLLKRTTDESDPSDRQAIESEITELKMALDLMP
ncbi:MAG: hypothetical protein WA421_15895 [Nitrososphaeraceae archaeon]